MRSARCPLCRLPFANAAAHVRTPELDGSTGDSTYWCLASERHITRRIGWVEDPRLSARGLLQGLRSIRRRG